MAHDSTNPRRQFALDVLRSLREVGFEAYWAGGCVRDQLLGQAPKDFDVATNATPEEVRKLFGRRRTLAVGAAFGVIIVLGAAAAGQVEVTTFRHDGRYSDGRRPDSVTFGTAEEDVRRRDFTINGMLYDPLADRVLDWVGGQADLRAGVVRAIGDPVQRFGEDKLRMLRAVRFAARLGFRLDDATRAAIVSMAGEIMVVAAERIAQEMRAILVHRSRAVGIELCRSVSLAGVMVPEVMALDAAAWEHTREVLRRLGEPTFPLALAVLLHATQPSTAAAAETALSVCERWRLSNEETERAVWLVRHQQDLRTAQEMPWPRLQRLLITPGIHELLALHEADLASCGQDIAAVDYCRQRLLLPREQLDPAPLITGHDLIRHGVPRGKVYQALLDHVRDAQLADQVVDAPSALAFVDRLLAAGNVAASPHVWRDG